MPWEKSFLDSTLSVFFGLSKLGHPVPESNFVSDENSSAPHPAQAYIPFSLLLWYLPVRAISVPFSRKTWYCSGFNFFFHSCSDFVICFIFLKGGKGESYSRQAGYAQQSCSTAAYSAIKLLPP